VDRVAALRLKNLFAPWRKLHILYYLLFLIFYLQAALFQVSLRC